MAATNPDLGFPLFTFESKSADLSKGRYLCLYRSVNENNPEGSFCGGYEKSFPLMIDHLKEKHQISMESKVDFCGDCCQAYESKLDAISHYFSHILLYEDKNLNLEPHDNQSLSQWLKPLFQMVHEGREKIMNWIFFEDDCDNILVDDIEILDMPELSTETEVKPSTSPQ